MDFRVLCLGEAAASFHEEQLDAVLVPLGVWILQRPAVVDCQQVFDFCHHLIRIEQVVVPPGIQC